MYSAEHDSEMYTQVQHLKLDADKSSLTYTRVEYPELDKTSFRYKHGLIEGETPDPEQIKMASYTISLIPNGWYYEFTDRAANHALHDLKSIMVNCLKDLFNQYHDEKIADAYLTSASVVTNTDLTKLEDLIALKNQLKKNKAKEIDGFYILKVDSDVTSKMLLSYKDMITHTTQKESLINGEIGEIAGFRLVNSNLQAFKKDSSKGYPFIAYGKLRTGQYPIGCVAYDNMNSQIIWKGLGELGNDPLNQRGSVGLKVDGHGFAVMDDSAVLNGYQVATGITATTPFDRSNLSNFVQSNIAASNIYPNATLLNLRVGETFQLASKDQTGANIDADVTYTSVDKTIATVDATTEASKTTKGKVTAVKKGITQILVTKGVYVSVVTIVVY